MKINKLAVVIMISSGVVNAAPITGLTITGGSFSVDGGTISPLMPGSFSNMTIGDYDGSIPNSSDLSATSIVTFNFESFGPAAVYTAETDGVTSGYAPTSGDVTNGILSLDLSGWTVWWNGNTFNQGSSSDLGDICAFNDCTTPIIIDSYQAATGDFSAHWDSVVSGPKASQIISWDIAGNVSAIPVPAAVWLFGSGLLGLIGLARQKSS